MTDYFMTVGGQHFCRVLETNSTKQREALERVALSLAIIESGMAHGQAEVLGRIAVALEKLVLIQTEKLEQDKL